MNILNMANDVSVAIELEAYRARIAIAEYDPHHLFFKHLSVDRRIMMDKRREVLNPSIACKQLPIPFNLVWETNSILFLYQDKS